MPQITNSSSVWNETWRNFMQNFKDHTGQTEVCKSKPFKSFFKGWVKLLSFLVVISAIDVRKAQTDVAQRLLYFKCILVYALGEISVLVDKDCTPLILQLLYYFRFIFKWKSNTFSRCAVWDTPLYAKL